MTSPVVDPENRTDALNAYKTGKSVDECAAMLGVSDRTLYKYLREAGIPLRRREPDLAAIDDAIRAYEAGSNVAECAAKCGIGRETFRQRLIERGIKLRSIREAHTGRKPTPDGLIDDYLGGMSVKATAAKYGHERSAVYRMLAEAGIDGRDRSSAMRLRWQRASAAERRAMLDSAHEAARGRIVTEAERGKIAIAKEGIVRSPLETELGTLVADLGYDVAYGVPCGMYNLDIVVAGTVAVEVFGGNFHETGNHRAIFPERSRYVLDAGYSLAIAWVDSQSYPIGVQCAQHLGTLTEITRGHPSIGRQHWVIRGDGHFLAVREDDGNEVPFVTASGRRDH